MARRDLFVDRRVWDPSRSLLLRGVAIPDPCAVWQRRGTKRRQCPFRKVLGKQVFKQQRLIRRLPKNCWTIGRFLLKFVAKWEVFGKNARPRIHLNFAKAWEDNFFGEHLFLYHVKLYVTSNGVVFSPLIVEVWLAVPLQPPPAHNPSPPQPSPPSGKN